MLSSFFEAVVSFARAAGERTGGFCFLPLAAPAALFLVLLAVRLCLRSRPAFRWFAALSDVCILLFAALALAGERDVLPLAAYALAGKAVYIALNLSLVLPLRPRKRRKKRPDFSEEEQPLFAPCGEGASSALSFAPASAACPPADGVRPQKICCFGEEEERVLVDRDVRLGPARTLLERLRAMPLGAGDRLETEKTAELLSVYEGKGSLTSAEADALNDIMASLLKMLARYDR